MDEDEIIGELQIKTGIAIQRLKEHEPPEGYFLAFSGGKDSCVIYDLAKKAGVKFDAHFHKTTVDPPEVLDFIKANYPDVIWDRPKKSMFQLILSESCLPTRTHRFCCRSLKEVGGKGRVIITGIRWEESTNRAKRQIYEKSNKNDKKWFLNPIIDWGYNDVWDYLALNQILHCSLYNEGLRRIGCILCPFLSTDDKLYHIKRWPKFAKAYRIAINKLYPILKSRNRLHKKWNSPDDVWHWWIYGKDPDTTTKQKEL